MNLITLLGAAAGCKEFCDLLMNKPLEAAQALGLVLTQSDLQSLKDVFGKLSSQEKQEMCDHLGAIAFMLCKHPPCPFVPLIAGREDFCKQAA